MKFFYKHSLTIIMMVFSLSTFAQKNFFSDVDESIAKSKSIGKRTISPEKFKTVQANVVELKAFLWSLPAERNLNRQNAPILELPMPDGSIAKFHVWQSSIQEPALEAKFPNIKTFAGQGIDDPYASIRFDFTEFGFHAQITSALTGYIYIDPYKRGDVNYYMSYYNRDNKRNANVICENKDEDIIPNGINARPESVLAGPCRGTELFTYRLAVACTGEYAVAVGGTTAALLHSAIVTSVNRVSGVYETEVSIRLILIANNNLIEFLNAATDPFNGNNSAGVLIGESQTVINNTIGAANYDIGHTFSTGGGGLAGLGVVCNNAQKARGITGSPSPVGDAYDIDFVAHEIGHQFAGNHAFNGAIGNCSGGNRNGSTAYEPGSGTTIQSYAGICGSDDIQLNSDPFFHTISFDEISNFVTNIATCRVAIPNGNTIPVITAMNNNGVSIPIGTPFTLTAAATDANGDAITYCWEQWDLGPQGTWNSGGTSTTAPIFKSRIPKVSGSRTFPDMAVILAGYPTNPPATLGGLKGEILPQVARALKFRLTVRDNRAGGGGVVTGGDGCGTFTGQFTINVAGTAPFAVTAPNGGETYPGGSTQNITWNIVGTNAAPFNVANVKISYSTDGGLTYPTVLSASTPNDGTEALTIPVGATTTARVKVEAVGNIFFDISNANFTVTAPVSDFNFGAITTSTSPCPAAATMTTNVPTTQTGGFANLITLAATAGVPAGTTVTFAANPVAPGATSVATLNNANTLSAGTYSVTITGTAAGASVKTTTLIFTITAGTGPALTTQSASIAVCAPATATFTVATAATPVTYQWQSAPAATPTVFTNISGATNPSFTTGATSAAMNGNVYHCIVSTQCGTTTSTNAILTVNTAAAITTQPINLTACTGGTATFTTAATGTGVSYQWQSGTSATGPWTNVGTNSTSYTTAPLTITTPTFYQVVVTTTTCAATVTSNVVTLGVSVTTAINTQPTAQTVCAGATATYTVAAVGTGVSYQWQSATSATGPWTNVGTNSASYTTAATNAGMNGMFFQVIVTGSCNTVTSTPMMLTVNTAAAITTQPLPIILCNGVAATFTAAGSGTGVTYQWQVSTTGIAGTYSNVVGGTGATTTSYTTVPTVPSMNGNYYRLVATTTTCAAVVNSNAVLLTVNTVAVIGTQPAPQSACIPQTATFNVAATGTGLTYQWQVALAATPTVFTDITGATTASYTTVPSVLTMNGNLYRVSILSTCSPTTPTISNAALLTVTNPVAITQQPTAKSGCIGDNYTFTSIASSPGNTITYQWQVSNTGAAGTFTNIAGANGTATATANAAYTITAASSFQNGTYYRIYFSVPCGTGISADTSAAGKLTLSLKPTIVLTAPNTSNVNAAVNQGLFTTISPANFVGTFNWTKNGTAIPNTLASTSILLPVDATGKYVVSTTDAITGCVSTSNEVDVKIPDNIAAGTLFAYPNPVSGIMQVRFNFPNVGTTGTMLNIYDEKGARIMSMPYTLTGTSGRMLVDMSRVQMGTYMVYLMDASGKKLGSTKVVKIQ
jgi:hypothetical protein